jgi:hypothetical protein
METTKWKDSVLALIGIAIGVAALFLVPSQIPGGSLSDIRDPSTSGFFPIIVFCALIVCCAVLLAGALLRSGGGDEVAEKLFTWRYIQGAALMSAYVFLISWLGMLVASGLLIVALSLAFGYRHWPYLIATAILMPLSIWFVFRKLLYIVFPSGVLF